MAKSIPKTSASSILSVFGLNREARCHVLSDNAELFDRPSNCQATFKGSEKRPESDHMEVGTLLESSGNPGEDPPGSFLLVRNLMLVNSQPRCHVRWFRRLATLKQVATLQQF